MKPDDLGTRRKRLSDSETRRFKQAACQPERRLVTCASRAIPDGTGLAS